MKTPITNKIRRPYLMAVVLGTAIAAMGSEASVNANEISPKAITNISRYCTACWRNAGLPQHGGLPTATLIALLHRVDRADEFSAFLGLVR